MERPNVESAAAPYADHQASDANDSGGDAMTRGIMLGVLVTMVAGCATDYKRELRATEPLSDHQFIRVEFNQTGHRNYGLFDTYHWYPVREIVLVADDGWRLVIHWASTTGYNWSPDDKRKNDPVIFNPGTADRLTLIDPQGGMHPVKVAVGDLSPRPPHVTGTRSF